VEGYDCLNKDVLSPRRKCDSVSLATTSCGRLFHSRAVTIAKARSPNSWALAYGNSGHQKAQRISLYRCNQTI